MGFSRISAKNPGFTWNRQSSSSRTAARSTPHMDLTDRIMVPITPLRSRNSLFHRIDVLPTASPGDLAAITGNRLTHSFSLFSSSTEYSRHASALIFCRSHTLSVLTSSSNPRGVREILVPEHVPQPYAVHRTTDCGARPPLPKRCVGHSQPRWSYRKPCTLLHDT